jgi:hypothetical protein
VVQVNARSEVEDAAAALSECTLSARRLTELDAITGVRTATGREAPGFLHHGLLVRRSPACVSIVHTSGLSTMHAEQEMGANGGPLTTLMDVIQAPNATTAVAVARKLWSQPIEKLDSAKLYAPSDVAAFVLKACH